MFRVGFSWLHNSPSIILLLKMNVSQIISSMSIFHHPRKPRGCRGRGERKREEGKTAPGDILLQNEFQRRLMGLNDLLTKPANPNQLSL